MKTVLIGATGRIGSRIAAEALGRGHEVTGATRHEKTGTRVVDANHADAVADVVAGHDAVVLAVRVSSGLRNAQTALLDLLRRDADDLDWTYISPVGEIEHGKRAGAFRVGGDQLLVDTEGRSRIGVEDHAVALVDEVEKGAHIRRRIHVAY
jgi:putative NADH-flavin reductase